MFLWTPKEEACVFLAARKSSEERKNRGTERDREVISLRRSFSYFRLREERVARGIFFLQPLPSLPSRGSSTSPKHEKKKKKKRERVFITRT